MKFQIHVELYRNDPVALMGISDAAKAEGGSIVDMSVNGDPGDDQRVSLTYAFESPETALSFKQRAMKQYDVAVAEEEVLPEPSSDKVLPVPERKVRPRAKKKRLWRKVPWSTS